MPLIPSAPGAQDAPKSRRKASLAAALKALEEGTAYGRRQAALDLVGEAEAAQPLIGRLDREEDGSVRVAILDALASIGTPEVVAALIDALRGDEADRRNEAVVALQQLSEQVADHIAGLLNDPDPDLRIMAVDVLRLLPHPDVPRWLRDLLMREQHLNVVGTAVDRLAEIGGPEDLEALHSIRTRFAGEPYILFAVDLVIQRIESMERDG